MPINVVIVEDNHSFRATLANYVGAAPGYSCVGACESAEEGLKLVVQIKPDVVLMDIHLPNMSGVECTRRVKDLCPAVQILILTVYEDNEKICGALKAGASGYLLKRAEPDEILRAIQEVKQGGAPMSSQIACRVVQSFREPVHDPLKDEKLSKREMEILEELSKGYSNKEIARRCGLTDGTVRWHLENVYHKLHVRSRTEAVLKYLK
jgi:DNA-binding NarL/FixJ family response regulator